MSLRNTVLCFLLLLLCAACSSEGRTIVQPPTDTHRRQDSGADLQADLHPFLPDRAGEDLLPDVPADGADSTPTPDLPQPTDAAETVPLPDLLEVDAGAPPCTADGECDDGLACTSDSCVDGLCLHEAPPGHCCTTSAECDDAVDCTTDTCAAGICMHQKADNFCCTQDADCDDFDPCTLDLCANEKCTRVFLAGAECQCADLLDCDDNLACTYEYCDNGQCVYDLNPVATGCCTSDSQCQDNDPVTVDRCVQYTCSNLPALPCLTDEHCDDDDPCTTDSCSAGGTCEHDDKFGCCHVNGQCDDGAPITTDWCWGNACVHALPDAPATTCSSGGDCPGQDPCVTVTCVNGHCSYAQGPGPSCCGTDADCDDGSPCTVDTCLYFSCSHAPATGPVPQVTWDFNNSLAGFTVNSSSNKVTWQLSSARFTSGPTALYFGDPSGPTLDNGSTVSGTVASPPVTVGPTTPLLLAGWTFIHCEPLYSRDLVSILIRHQGSDTEVWNKEEVGGTTGGGWLEVFADLTSLNLAGKSIQVVFAFDSVDAINNNYEGIYFDDIQLLWPCGE